MARYLEMMGAAMGGAISAYDWDKAFSSVTVIASDYKDNQHYQQTPNGSASEYHGAMISDPTFMSRISSGYAVGSSGPGGGVLGGLAGAGGGLLQSLGAALGPLVTGFVGMLSSVSSVSAILNPLQTILKAMFDVIGPTLNTILKPIVGILVILGKSLGQILVPILNALMPIIEALAQGFIWLYNKIIMPIGNALYATIMVLVNSFLNFADLIASIANHLLNPSKWGAGGRSTNWGDLYANGPLSAITTTDLTAAGATATAAGATATDAGTSTPNASYTGSQPITFNFYNQGNVVGSGGLEELATLIDSILKRNARYA